MSLGVVIAIVGFWISVAVIVRSIQVNDKAGFITFVAVIAAAVASAFIAYVSMGGTFD